MKKKLLTAALLTFCAIALVVSSVLTTIALLTSSSGVSNVFTVGDVKISMYETKVNSKGQPVDASGTVIDYATGTLIKVDTNSYHLIPGETYIKDPTIYINSGELDDMYLFVKSRNEIRSAEEGNFIGTNTGTETVDNVSKTMREQMHANGWVEFVRSGDGVEIIWVYGKRDIVSGDITPFEVNRTSTQKITGTDGQLVDSNRTPGEFRLCEEFTIHQDAQVALYGAAEVTFTAFAIQSKGFEGDSNEKHALTCSAWEAIKKSFPIDFSIINPVNPYSNTANPYDPVSDVTAPIPVPPQVPGATNSGTGSEGSETEKPNP